MLASNTEIRGLCISRVKLSEQEMSELVRILSSLELDLFSSLHLDFTESGFCTLMHVLAQNQLKVLEMNRWPQTPLCIVAFVALAATQYDLLSFKCEVDCRGELLSILGDLHALSTVEITNESCCEYVDAIADLLRRSSTITSLRFSTAGLTQQQMEELLSALRDNTSVTN